MDNRPIGVFDSGLGGLTVVRELQALLPHERIVYLGDTARVPYGPRSKRVVTRFALQDAYFLAGQNVKYIVVACNTASAQAEEALRQQLAIPVAGVIEPAARAAVCSSRSGRIGVIGTVGTIGSGAYQRAIARLRSDATIVAAACPLFVPLVEEGELDGEATTLIACRYLAPLIDADIDTLIMGCTHYPLLAETLAGLVGPSVVLIDAGRELARSLAAELSRRDLCAEPSSSAEHRFYVTDRSIQFQEIAERFLGSGLTPEVAQVELD